MYTKEIKEKAKLLRKSGFSLKEVSMLSRVSEGTLSLWFKDIILDNKAKARLELRIKSGRLNANSTNRNKRIAKEKLVHEKSIETIKKVSQSLENKKLACALLYYCEGNKSIKNGVSFINSDPEIIMTFLSLFRSCFTLNEVKFRLCIHLHNYHDEKTQKRFWSKITNLPNDNFTKSFLKNEGGLYKKENYQGCLRIRYHDADIARELLAIAKEYFKSLNSGTF